MRFRVVLVCLAVLGVAASPSTIAAAPAPNAGPPGKWTRITDTNLDNIDEVGLARTSDGVLHVLWPAQSGALDNAVMHTGITPKGEVAGTQTVEGGLHSLRSPDLIVEPSGGLRTFFGATTGVNDHDGIRTASAGPDGASWTVQALRASKSQQAGEVGAALTSSGTPIFAWAISFHLYVHTGMNPTTPDLDLRTETKCCDYSPDLATDSATGETFVAWYSNATGEFGTWVQRVAPSLGEKTFVPGSAQNGNAVHPRNRTQIAARIGAPGVFVAYCGEYPECKRARLWQVGSGEPMTVGRGGDVESVGISASPGGRLWVFWQDNDSDLLKATRSNPAATKMGAIVKVKPPKGTTSLWRVAGEGSLGHLDLFSHVSTGNSIATWHTQVRPGLTLRCQGGKVINCTVSDAGDPLGGAKVTIGGKTLTSNSKGKVSVNLPPGTFVAKATKGGYTGASKRVKSK
jgi:hypothetical protein